MKDTFDCLYQQSKLPTKLTLTDWFSKCVVTLPNVVGRTVRWKLVCYECGKVRIPEMDTWGMKHDSPYIYSESICVSCLKAHYAALHLANNQVAQYEI